MAKFDIDVKVNGADQAVKLRKEINNLEKSQDSLKNSNIKLKEQILKLNKADVSYKKEKELLTQKINKNTLSIQKNNQSLKTHKNNLSAVETQNKKTSNSTNKLKSAVVGLATVASAKKIIEYADSWKLANSRLKLVTSSSKNLDSVEKALFATAQDTRQSYQSSVDLYTRLSKASDELGTSQNDVLKVTKAVSQALIVSGATTAEASSVMVQLSQGLASGVLRGEEFNSIMEGGSRVADALADSLGVARGDLRAMAEEGQLTSDVVMTALIEQSKTIDKEFKTMGTTVSQTGTVINNAFEKAIGTLDKATGTTDVLGDTMKTAFYGASVVVTELTNAFDSMGAIIAGIAFRLENGIFLSDEESKALDKMYEGTKKNIEAREKALEVLDKELFTKDKIITNIEKDTNATKNNTAVKKETINTLFEQYENEFALLDVNYAKKEALAQKDNDLTDKRLQGIREVQNELLLVSGDETAIFYQDIGDKVAELGEKGATSAEQLQYFNLALASFEDSKALKSLDESSNSFTSILDAQISLAESTQDWTDSLEGNAKAIAGVGKAFNKMHVNNLKAQKEDINIQKKYAKAFLKAKGDEKKIAKASYDFDKDKAKLDYQNTQNRLEGIGAISGAVAQATEEGSKAHEIAQMAQMASAVTSGVLAVIQAGTNGDPYTAVARMVAMAATVSGYLSQGGGGSVSGGGSSSVPSASAKIQNNTDLITDRLDRQIELLEVIGYEGSASSVNLEKGIAELMGARDIYTIDRKASLLDVSQQQARVDLLQIDKDEGYVDAGYWRDATNSLARAKSELQDVSNTYAEAINKLVVESIEGINKLGDASQTMKDIFDELTNSNKYATESLKEAKTNLSELMSPQDIILENGTTGFTQGFTQLEDYLASSIENIDSVMRNLTPENLELLYTDIGSNATLQKAQDDLAMKIADDLGLALDGGAKDVLNFIESIELVSESMISSNNNVKEWEDSLKTSDELLAELANTLGVKVATTAEELNDNFEYLKGGIDGLNDAELELLNTNRKAIESLGGVVSGINSVTSATLNQRQSLRDQLEMLEATDKEALKRKRTLEDITDAESKSIQTDIFAEQDRQKQEKERLKKEQEEAKQRLKIEQERIRREQKAREEAHRASIKRAKEAEQARVKAIQEGLKNSLRAIENSIGITTSSIDKMKSVTERLRESSLGSTNTLNKFYESMSATIGLSKKGDYAKFSESLDKTIGYSSVLDNLSAFGSKKEQDFARLVASSQFEDLTGVMETELSVLKRIEANTRTKLVASGVQGFSSGGYTGNGAINEVAGVVHKEEYVVNAQTTKDLGLNGQSGLFSQMNQKLNVIASHLFEVNKTTKKQLKTEIGIKNTLIDGEIA